MAVEPRRCRSSDSKTPFQRLRGNTSLRFQPHCLYSRCSPRRPRGTLVNGPLRQRQRWRNIGEHDAHAGADAYPLNLGIRREHASGRTRLPITRCPSSFVGMPLWVSSLTSSTRMGVYCGAVERHGGLFGEHSAHPDQHPFRSGSRTKGTRLTVVAKHRHEAHRCRRRSCLALEVVEVLIVESTDLELHAEIWRGYHVVSVSSRKVCDALKPISLDRDNHSHFDYALPLRITIADPGPASPAESP